MVNTSQMLQSTVEDRVRALIEGSGLTQEAFGASVGLDPTKLSKALNSKRRFSSLELARIAEANQVTVDWLMNGDGSTVAARVSADHSSVERAIELANLYGESRDNVIFLRGAPKQLDTPVLSNHALMIDQGAELADFALGLLGSPDVLEGSDFAAVIEDTFGFDVAVAELDGGCDGLALGTKAGARVLLVATSENPTRQRFTMAHELAHLLCSDDQGLHVDEDVMAKGDLLEMRASAFASRLLMPDDLLGEMFAGSEITEAAFANAVMRLKVSPSSLAWRLLTLKLASAEQRVALGSMRTIDCAAAVGKLDAYAAWVEASRQPRIPRVLLRDLLQGYLEGSATLRPLANMMKVPVEALRRAIETAGVPAEASDADEYAP